MRGDPIDTGVALPVGRFAVLSLAIVAGWLVYCRLTFHSLARFMTVVDHCPVTFCDFANHYLPMSRQVLAGTGPVPGFLYPPFFALLLLPFAPLPDAAATFAWGAVQAGLAGLLLVAPLWLVRRPGLGAAALGVFLSVSAFPMLHNFKWGQISVLVTLCVLGALALWQRGRPVAAGLLLALATSIKLYPAWFALALLLRRDWRALASYAAFCLLFLGVVPALALGPSAALRFYQDGGVLLHLSLGMQVNDINSQSLEGLLARLCYSVNSPWPTTLSLFEPIRWSVLAITLPAVWWSLRRREGGEVPAFLVLFGTLPFVTPTSWPHYFVYLPAAFVYLLHTLPPRGARRFVVIALVAVAAVVSNGVFWQAWNDRTSYSYAGFLFWANALTLLSLLLVLPGIGTTRRRNA